MPATSVRKASQRSVVRCRVAGSARAQLFDFGCEADVAGARRMQRGFRRIDRVDLRRAGSSWRCILSGVGHRAPVSLVVPLRIGLGLAVLGVSIVVSTEDASSW